MPKFIITDRIPCWVNFRYEIEAESEAAARQGFIDGEATDRGYDVADSVDWVSGETIITAA
jgi:hypothetical protein